jgi:signal transduction histidine kinase
MSLRYKILAVVIGINVVILFATFTTVFLEALGRTHEHQDFAREALDQTKTWALSEWKIHSNRGAANWNAPLVEYVVECRLQGEGLTVLGGSLPDPSRLEGRIRTRVQEALQSPSIIMDFQEGVVVIAPEVHMSSEAPLPDGEAPLPDGETPSSEAPLPDGESPSIGLYVKQVESLRFRDPMQGVKRIYVAMMLGTVLLMVVTFVLVSRLILVPIDSLVNASNRIARGDYSEPVPSTNREDEVEMLIEAFNAMMIEVSSYRQHLEDRVGEATRKVKLAEKNLTIAQRLAATGKLASGIAHEVNNPLGGMINAARRLRSGELTPEKTDQYVELIEDGLTRVRETVKKILSFTPHRVKPQAVNLRVVLDRALGLVMHRSEKAGAEIRVDVPEEGLSVFGDPFELQQIFLNLIINALDAIEGADRRGVIEVVGEVESDTDISLRISDNGRGMDEKQMALAFDLFYTTKEVGEGTGLGLSIVHNIVTNHGGRIEIRSREDEGTAFTIHLPRLTAREEPS